MRLVVLGIFEEYSVHVGTGVLEQLVGAGEEYQRDLDVAQHAQLVLFLHQTELALRERHLSSHNTVSVGSAHKAAGLIPPSPLLAIIIYEYWNAVYNIEITNLEWWAGHQVVYIDDIFSGFYKYMSEANSGRETDRYRDG